MSLLMPEQEADSQVDEPTSIQSLAIISEFLFNYERWCAGDEFLLSYQLEEPQLEEKWRLDLSQVQSFFSIMCLYLVLFWEVINSFSPFSRGGVKCDFVLVVAGAAHLYQSFYELGIPSPKHLYCRNVNFEAQGYFWYWWGYLYSSSRIHIFNTFLKALFNSCRAQHVHDQKSEFGTTG